jgi:hypothetical protein
MSLRHDGGRLRDGSRDRTIRTSRPAALFKLASDQQNVYSPFWGQGRGFKIPPPDWQIDLFECWR